MGFIGMFVVPVTFPVAFVCITPFDLKKNKTHNLHVDVPDLT